MPNWSQFSGMYKFRRPREQTESSQEEEGGREEEVLNSLLITFRALMSDLDLDTWMDWCEVGFLQ